MNQPLPPWPPTDPTDPNAASGPVDPYRDAAPPPPSAGPVSGVPGPSFGTPAAVGWGPPPWIGWAPPPPRRKAWPIVVAGLGGFGLGVLITIAGVVVLSFTDIGTRTAKRYEANSAAARAEPGDCFSQRDLKQAEVSTVDCDDSHAFEVYARRPALSGEDAPYPTEEFDLMADGICIEEFKAYVSRSYYSSDLEYTILIPSREAWSKGEHDIVCGLYDFDGNDLEGTSKGSGR